MNVLLINSLFPPVRTGSSYYTVDVANALMRRRHNVIVVTLENSESKGDNYNFPVYRLKAFHFPIRNFFKHFRICFFYLNNYKRLNTIIRDNKIDIIFLINHYHDISWLAVFATIFTKVPLICSINTQLQLFKPIRDKILNFFDWLICGFTVFPFCKKLIAGDTEMVRYLSDVHGKSIINKTVIIGSGLHGDLKPFLDFKKTYEINNKLIGVGGVIEQRNFIFPILVFNKLLKIFPDLTFKIIGHVYYDAVVKLIKKLGIEDKVIITEELPHDEVIEELKKSDVYFGIMTAKYLGLGTATLEAMMLGVPTISNVPPYYFDNPPMIDMENYIYANINEIDEATKKVEKVLTDYTLREHIGEKGKEFAMTCEHFNWDKIAEKMEILFNNIVRK